MAKAAAVTGNERPVLQPVKSPGGSAGLQSVRSSYENAIGFLRDVRSEMRKVVSPSRKEVQATTTVVVITVLIFALYFWGIDALFGNGLRVLLSKLANQ